MCLIIISINTAVIFILYKSLAFLVAAYRARKYLITRLNITNNIKGIDIFYISNYNLFRAYYSSYSLGLVRKYDRIINLVFRPWPRR